jgi:hypothetical protein
MISKEISSNLLKVPVKMAFREKIMGLVDVRLSRILSFKGRVGRAKILSYPRLHPSSPLLSFQKACLGLPIIIY